MVALTLNYPVSSNRYWRTYMPKGFKAPVTVVSAEAKAYKRHAVGVARLAGLRTPLEGRVALTVTLHPHRPLDWAKRAARDPGNWTDTVQCIDLDNALKVLIDALRGVAYVDDKQVKRIHAEIGEPIPEGCVVLLVEPIVIKHRPTVIEHRPTVFGLAPMKRGEN